MFDRGVREFRQLPREARVPLEVRRLHAREHELAMIVYALRAATAAEVMEYLSAPLANPSVRSMLNRLVAKGVLTRKLCDKAFVYLPAISIRDSRESALRRFAEDYFAGSVPRAAETMKQLLSGSTSAGEAPWPKRAP